MKIPKTCFAALALAVVFPFGSAQSALLDLQVSFGTNSFEIDGPSTTSSYIPSASGLTFSPAVELGHTLGGFFLSAQDLSGSLTPTSALYLKMAFAGPDPLLPVTLDLVGPDFASMSYEGYTGPSLAHPGYFKLQLSPNTPWSDSVAASVLGAQLTWNGAGTVNATLTGLAVDNSWTWRAPTIQGNSLNHAAVSPGASETIVVAGEVGTILTRTNTNSEWIHTHFSGVGDFLDLFRSGDHFLAALRSTNDGRPLLLRSIDGLDWLPLNPPLNFDFSSVSGVAADSNRIVAITYDGKSAISTNAGVTWTNGGSLRLLSGSNYYSGLETSGNGAWVAAGTGGSVGISTNGGLSWSNITIPNAAGFSPFGLETDGSNFILFGGVESAVGFAPRAFRSVDGGFSWANTLVFSDFGLSNGTIDKIFGLPGRFLAVVSGEEVAENAEFPQYRTSVYSSSSGGSSWDPVALAVGNEDSPSAWMISRLLSGVDGTIHAFGVGGLVATIPPDLSEVQLLSQPFLAAPTPEFFATAGFDGKFIAVDVQSGRSIHSVDGVNFSLGSGFTPRVVAQVQGGFRSARTDFQSDMNDPFGASAAVLAFESSSDGSEWNPVDTIPQLTLSGSNGQSSYFSALGLAEDPLGLMAALVLEQNWSEAYPQVGAATLRLYGLNSTWTNLTKVAPSGAALDLGFFPNGSWASVRPKLEWDGSRFLLLSPKGRLFSSTNATNWTLLPPLPGDPAAYMSNFTEYRGLKTNNLVWSFASGNGTIVARPCKLDGYTNVVPVGPDRFFVLGANATTWTQIQPPQTAVDRFEGNNIVWNGSIFASANSAGMLWTSTNGTNWTRRELGADVKVLTWTGKGFVGLTEHSSIITHPNGLSQAAVVLATPTITKLPQPTAITYGQALSNSFLTMGNSSVAGSWSWADPSIKPDAGQTTRYGVVFTPSDPNYRSVSTNLALNVRKAVPAITWGDIDPIVFRTPLSGTQLSASAGAVSGKFTYNPTNGSVLNAGTNPIVATFRATDSNNYISPVTRTNRVVVRKLDQNITFAEPAVPVFSNNRTFNLSAVNDSGLPVRFVSLKPAVVSVVGNVATIKGAGEVVTLVATNAGTANVNPAGASRVINVAKADQVVTFNPPTNHVLIAGRKFNLVASADSKIPVTFTSLNTNVVSVAGNVATLRGVGEAVLTARNSGNANYKPVELTRTITVSPPPPASGSYKGTFKRQLFSGLAVPSAMPADNSVVSFTVSPDLQSCTFAGRTFPLSGDGRPVSLNYAITAGSLQAALTLHLDASGVVTAFSGGYTQVGLPPRSASFTSQSGSVAKQP